MGLSYFEKVKWLLSLLINNEINYNFLKFIFRNTILVRHCSFQMLFKIVAFILWKNLQKTSICWGECKGKILFKYTSIFFFCIETKAFIRVDLLWYLIWSFLISIIENCALRSLIICFIVKTALVFQHWLNCALSNNTTF